MTMTAARVRPFEDGTQDAVWSASNCRRCHKGWREGDKSSRCRCDIEQALLVAYFEDGMISQELAARMTVPNGMYVWKCGEFFPKDKVN